MSGPIVRSGPTPEFSKNWESVFGRRQAPKAAQPAGKGSGKGSKTKKKKKSGK
jgi:hypothetical protein